MPQYYTDEETGHTFFIDSEGDEVFVDEQTGEEWAWRDPSTGETGSFEDDDGDEPEDDDVAGWLKAAEDTLGRRMTDREVQDFLVDFESGRPIDLSPEAGFKDLDNRDQRVEYLSERLSDEHTAEQMARSELAADARGTFDEGTEGEVEDSE